jgi:hypothetical protein
MHSIQHFLELVPSARPDTCNRLDLFRDLLIQREYPDTFEKKISVHLSFFKGT